MSCTAPCHLCKPPKARKTSHIRQEMLQHTSFGVGVTLHRVRFWFLFKHIKPRALHRATVLQCLVLQGSATQAAPLWLHTWKGKPWKTFSQALDRPSQNISSYDRSNLPACSQQKELCPTFLVSPPGTGRADP